MVLFIMKVLVTGFAGFIGFHLCERLLSAGHDVIGVDNLNPYYDVNLKLDRLFQLRLLSNRSTGNLVPVIGCIEDEELVNNTFRKHAPEFVVNLAAQAGVRYSLESPHTYIESNVLAFTNILEACRHNPVKHLVYASSSSVYGGNTSLPFRETDVVDNPVSLYAATKKSNELMAHTYSHLFGIPTTGLRFFTVYGPWGRPDMALFLFTKSILEGSPIQVFNNGQMTRDFTYVMDIVESIERLIPTIPSSNCAHDSVNPVPSSSWAPYKIFNIGNSSPVPLMKYIQSIEAVLEKKAILNLMPMQPGDVQATAADTSALDAWIGYKPATTVPEGVKNFVEWYRSYYKV